MSAIIESRLGSGSSRCLRAVFDELIPPDDTAGGWEGGVRVYLEQELDRALRWAVEPLRAAVATLEDRARAEDGRDFSDLDSGRRGRVLAAHLAAADSEPMLARVAMEGYYAAITPALGANWRSIGFDPEPAVTNPPVTPAPVISPERLRPRYDAIVIGAGAGGGVLAGLLAESGQTVLLVERAAPMTDEDLRGDHLRGKRLAVYDVNVGPGPGHPRVLELPDGSEEIVDGNRQPWPWGLNAMCVGGGTRLWQGMAWRFLPDDFAMATVYGTPEDGALADWPFSYDDLEPYYDRAEWEIGVSGDDHALTGRTPRTRGYPMPSLPPDGIRLTLARAADRLGWRTGPIPFAINSRPRDGRAACVQCPQCMGHTCPVNAKNGSHNTLIERGVKSGNCDLLAPAQALRIEDGRHGKHAVVTLGVANRNGINTVAIAAERVAVCAGAIETPRLLQCSGLGNPQVGRYLHSHTIHLELARAEAPIGEFRGPGHSVATLDFAHGGGAPYGGGVIFDAPSMLPLAAAQTARLFGEPTWGRAHKEWMRRGRRHVIGTMAIGQEIPHAATAVSIHQTVRDKWGMPVASIRELRHDGSQAILDFLKRRCREWLDATGCRPGPIVLTGTALAEHAAGSCRMGDDERTSACDRTGRVHGTSRVYVCDASLHPSNGSVNPALTVMANAYRIADSIATSC